MSWLLENLQTVSVLTGFMSDGLSSYAKAAEYGVAASNAEMRAQADEFNADIAEQQAAAERTSTQADIADFRREQSARLAASRAQRGGSGFMMEGSPALIDEVARSEIEFSVARLAQEGETRARRLEQRGAFDRWSARTERSNASSARSAGRISTFSSAVGAIGRVAGDLKPTLIDGQVRFG